jgi:putative cell wall-binding protein
MRRKLRKPLAILLAFAMVFCVAPNIGFAADNDANSVERVSGHDRYETAANIAEYAFPNGADAVVIANGEPALGYADALAGSFLAGAAEAPILLTQANVLPDATAEAIETLNATRAYVLGGELAVSDAVYSELEALGLEVERVWGQNRYATAVKVYETGAELVGTVNTALIANATRPSDALAAGAYANEANVPVLLVDQDSIHPATEAALAGIENTFVIGGNLVVSDEVVSELDATRVSGRTRNATSVAVAETLWESPENFVLVNGADGIVDALAGSVLGMPILYVPSDDVDAYLDKVITANSRGLILGGVNRISDEFLNEIQQKIEGVEEELQVVSVSAINATTIEVVFEGVEEPVTFELEEELVDGENTVTFEYEGIEYTVTVNYEAPAPVVDKSALEEAIADAAVYEEEAYTAETWEVFAEALANAEEVVANEEATQEEVDEALEALEAAIAGLEKAPVALSVESVSAINANQISVTFDNGETVIVDLEVALVEGENEVTFEYEGVEYTETVTYEAPDTEAPVLVYDGETTFEVEFGAEFTLPEVTATDNVDEAVEVTSVITLNGETVEAIDTTVAGTYTITYSAVDAAGNAAESLVITVNVAEEALKVESVSAINDINVEFGGAYELPATVEITLSDETVVEVPVTWEDTVDVKVAGTYALVGTLDLSELEDVAATDKVANVNVVVAKAVPYSLTTDADAIIDAVVGNNVSITYAVKDKNGNAVVGTDVRVRAIDTGWPGGVVEEQVLTTDENGQVTFVYTSTDGRDDDIQAVVLEKPTLRNTDVAVQWVETAAKVIVESPEAKGFIVDSATNIDAELMTIKYVATFLDEDGKPLADGKTVTVDLTGVTGVLTSGINDEFAAAAGVCTATLANGDGTAVLEFTAGIAQEIEPLFYYDIDGFGLDPEDPRAKGAKVEVVDGDTQEPTFTLELKEVDEDKNVNTDVTEVDGVLQVLEGSTVEYLLTAIDQYGNPFIGTAQLSHKNLLDDLAGNDTLHGAIVFEAADVDGAYAVATNINFDSVDVAADGIVQVQVTTGAADDYTTLVVWVDADGNLELDADEVSIESKMIEFVAVPAKVLTSMDIEADLTTVVADNFNDVEYTVELLDQDGNGLDVSGAGDSVDVVIELYKDGEKVDQSAAGASKIDSVGTLSVGTYAAAGKNVKITGINANDGKFDFTVLPAAADAGSSFYPVVYIDINNNGTIEADEIDTAVQGPAFEATALPNSYEVDLPKTKVVAGETIDVKITALDSAPATEVNFNGEHIVKIEIQDSSDATLKTYNRAANFVKGVATVQVPVELVTSNKVKITMTLGTTPTKVAAKTLTVEAAEASKLAIVDPVGGDDSIYVADKYGNKVKYNFEGLATVTTDGTFSGAAQLDDENQMVVKIVNGDVNDASDTALEFTGAAKNSLTLELANGDTFTVTIK